MNPDDPKTSLVRRHLFISGIVQGVFFRDGARVRADALRVTGYVRNLRDGRVEVVAEGERESVEQLVAWCRRGPSSARVEHIEIQEEPYQGEFRDFMIQRSA